MGNITIISQPTTVTVIDENTSIITAPSEEIVVSAAGTPGSPGAPGAGVARGGTTGQILAKTSNADYATGWINSPAGGGGALLAENDLSDVANQTQAQNNLLPAQANNSSKILSSNGTNIIWGFAPVYNFADHFPTDTPGTDATTPLQNFLLYCQLQALALKNTALDDQGQRVYVTAYIPRGYYTLTCPIIVPPLVNLKCDGLLVRTYSSGAATNNYNGDTTSKAFQNLYQPTVIIAPNAHCEKVEIYCNNDGVHSGAGMAVGKNWTASSLSVGAAGTGYHVGDVLTLAQPNLSPFIAAQATVTSINGSGGVTGISLTNPGAYALPPVLQTQQWTSANGFPVFDGSGNFLTTGGTGTNATIAVTWVTDWVSGNTTYQVGQGGLIADTILGHIRIMHCDTTQDATYGNMFGLRCYGLNMAIDDVEIQGGRYAFDFSYCADVRANRLNVVGCSGGMIFNNSSSILCPDVVIDTPSGDVLTIDQSQGIHLRGRAFTRNVHNLNTNTNYTIKLGLNSGNGNPPNTGIVLDFELTNCGSSNSNSGYTNGNPALYIAYTQAFDINLICNNQMPGFSGTLSPIIAYATFGSGVSSNGQLRGSIDGAANGLFSGTVPPCGIFIYNALTDEYVTQGIAAGTAGQLQFNSNGGLAGDVSTTDGAGNLSVNTVTIATTSGMFYDGSITYNGLHFYGQHMLTRYQLDNQVTNGSVISAIGFTPYNASNPAGYLSSAVTTFNSRNGAVTLTSSDVTGALGFTPYSASNPSGYTSNTGTVTSIAATGANGINVSGSPITGSGTIALSLGAITPTSVAASGAVTGSNLSGTNTGDQTNITGNAGTVSTINGLIAAGSNITLSGAGTAASPYSIAGNAGTVTSVAATGANGIGVSGSPITGSGTLALSLGAITPTSVNINSGNAYQINSYNAVSFPISDSTAGGTIAIGRGALANIPSTSAGYYNTAVGYNALSGALTTAALRNTTLGASSMSNLTSGTKNAALGSYSGNNISSGGSNTCVGDGAMAGNGGSLSGNNNVAIGQAALNAITGSMSLCTAVGAGAGNANNGGTGNNTFIGGNAGNKVTSGGNNTLIGQGAGGVTLTTGSNNIYIGVGVDAATSSESNVLNIGNAIKVSGLGATLGYTFPGFTSAGVVQTSASGVLSVGNPNALTRRAIADAATTLASTDYLIAYTSLTATRAITLPAASSITGASATNAVFFVIHDESGSASNYNITITGTVDGATNKSISVAYGSIRIYSNGTAWFTW